MKPTCFIDSNILIYALTDKGEKGKVASNLIRNYSIVISTQVLNEFCNVVLRKNLMTFDEVKWLLPRLQEDFKIMLIDFDLVKKTLEIKQRLNYSYWDSLIVATALASGVTTLYSEDMRHSQVIDGQITILNPFKSTFN